MKVLKGFMAILRIIERYNLNRIMNDFIKSMSAAAKSA
jgi:hypothetical protein